MLHLFYYAYITHAPHSNYEKVFRNMTDKNPKYPSEELNEEDVEALDNAILIFAAKFCALTERYSSPKKYVEQTNLNAVNKDTNIAILYMLAYAKNSPEGHQFRPGEINQRLANDIQNAVLGPCKDLIGQLEYITKFLNSRDLREGVLRKLEKQEILMHLTTKDEILNQSTKFSNKRTSSKRIHNERGGKLSAYILSEETEKLKRALDKPAGVEYIYRKVSKSRLLEKGIKFLMLVFLYAAKIDKKSLDVTKGATAVFFQEPPSRADTTDVFQELQKIDDDRLEQLVESKIKSIIEDQRIYTILFFTELVKL